MLVEAQATVAGTSMMQPEDSEVFYSPVSDGPITTKEKVSLILGETCTGEMSDDHVTQHMERLKHVEMPKGISGERSRL